MIFTTSIQWYYCNLQDQIKLLESFLVPFQLLRNSESHVAYLLCHVQVWWFRGCVLSIGFNVCDVLSHYPWFFKTAILKRVDNTLFWHPQPRLLQMVRRPRPSVSNQLFFNIMSCTQEYILCSIFRPIFCCRLHNRNLVWRQRHQRLFPLSFQDLKTCIDKVKDEAALLRIHKIALLLLETLRSRSHGPFSR